MRLAGGFFVCVVLVREDSHICLLRQMWGTGQP
jgi:hypothetical protein